MSTKANANMDDPNIVPRVKIYLEENVDKTYIDVAEMASALRQKYAEYAARPQNKFRKLVEQAYRVVSLRYGLECEGSSNDESDGSDVEVMDESAGKNMMKNIMNDLYNKAKKPNKDSGTKTSSGAEAIDISSDDDDAEEKQINSTTQKKAEPANMNSIANKNFPARITITPVPTLNSTTGTNGATKDATAPQQTSVAQKRRDIGRSDTHSAKKFASNQQLLQQLRENPVASAIESFRNGLNAVGGMSANGQVVKHQPVKKYKKVVSMHQSNVTFQSMGGIEKQLKELCEILIHLKVPDIYYELGVVPPRGILLHGPSGCGKSMLASAIAGQLTLPIISVPATELIAGVSGESEERIRDIFEQAKAAAPCVLFIDEIDTISTNRLQAQKEMERRVVSQLISSIDSLRVEPATGDVLLIGATSRPDALDPALRRDGRFDHEIALTIPNRKERKEILRVVCDGMRVDPKLDYDKIAELTPGYVGADLIALSTRAATIAVKKKWTEQMHKLKIERPITIVDLDDIDESIQGEDGKDGKDGKDGNDATNNKDNDNSNSNEKSNAVLVNEEEKAQETAEKPKEIAESQNDDPPAEKEAAGDAVPETTAEDSNIPNGENMDVDDEAPEAPKSPKEEENKELSVAGETIPEPTLGEMINWLDSPPDDLALDDFCITLLDFCEAVKTMQPSAKREGFITVPDVTWDDIGSLHDIREELRLAILAPVKYPDVMIRLGLEAPSGVLLCGPPGCGKTLIAKAIANEAGINFISVKGPELMNMYVGESERAVRDCFQRARNSAPCVIFFDEFDSLCPKRSQTNESSSGTRIVNQLLTEMDGIQERKGVYIMAASNRPDIIDPAILRPGRLDSILYVGMPEAKDRHEILIAATKNRKNPMLAENVDLMDIANRTEGYSGADLTGLLRQASMLALKDSIAQGTQIGELYVCKENFDKALELVRPSISEQDRKTYDALRNKYAAPRKATE